MVLPPTWIVSPVIPVQVPPVIVFGEPILPKACTATLADEDGHGYGLLVNNVPAASLNTCEPLSGVQSHPLSPPKLWFFNGKIAATCSAAQFD